MSRAIWQSETLRIIQTKENDARAPGGARLLLEMSVGVDALGAARWELVPLTMATSELTAALAKQALAEEKDLPPLPSPVVAGATFIPEPLGQVKETPGEDPGVMMDVLAGALAAELPTKESTARAAALVASQAMETKETPTTVAFQAALKEEAKK